MNHLHACTCSIRNGHYLAVVPRPRKYNTHIIRFDTNDWRYKWHVALLPWNCFETPFCSFFGLCFPLPWHSVCTCYYIATSTLLEKTPKQMIRIRSYQFMTSMISSYDNLGTSALSRTIENSNIGTSTIHVQWSLQMIGYVCISFCIGKKVQET